MNVKIILDEYFEKKKSIVEIAEKLDTYPNRIRRLILKSGRKLRTKSEAQTLALKTGRHIHPTKGTKRSPEIKEKIGQSVSQSWKDISKKEKKRRSLASKEQWDKMPLAQKKEMQKRAVLASRAASVHGSKIELALRKFLTQHGYVTEFHIKKKLHNQQFEIDIFLPEQGIAIEIDGPAHFQPVWGEDTLAKRQEADKRKKELILGSQLKFIRIKYHVKHVSKILKEQVCKDVIDILKNDDFNYNYAELEIKL